MRLLDPATMASAMSEHGEEDDGLTVYTCNEVQIGTDGGLASTVMFAKDSFKVMLSDSEELVKQVELGIPHVAQLRHHWEGSTLGFWAALARSFYINEHGVLQFNADRLLPAGIRFLPVYDSATNEAIVLSKQSGVSKDYGKEKWTCEYIQATESPFALECSCARSQFGPKIGYLIPSSVIIERAVTLLEIEDITLTDSTATHAQRRTDAKVESIFDYFTEELRYDADENKLYMAAIEKDRLLRFTEEQISAQNNSLIVKMKDKVELEYRRLTASTMMAAGKEGDLSEELRVLEEYHREEDEQARVEKERRQNFTSKRGGPSIGELTPHSNMLPPAHEEGDHVCASDMHKHAPRSSGTGIVAAPQPHVVRTALLQPAGPGRSRMSTELILACLQAPSCHLSPYLGEACSPHDLLALARDCCSLVEIDNRRERIAVRGRPIESVYVVIRGVAEEDHGTHFQSRREGEVLGEGVLRGESEWRVDIETTHLRPHMNRGLVHAVHKGAVPQQSLRQALHNTLWLCKIEVVSLLRHVGRATTVTHEASNYLQCFWRFLKITPYLEQAAQGKAAPVFPPESLEENGSGKDRDALGDDEVQSQGAADRQRHEVETAAIVRRVQEQLGREKEGRRANKGIIDRLSGGEGDREEADWERLVRHEKEESDLLTQLRGGKYKLHSPGRKSGDPVSGTGAGRDGLGEQGEEEDGADGSYHGPFAGLVTDTAAPTTTTTTTTATSDAERRRALEKILSVSESVRSSDLMAGAVREVMAGDVVIEQGQPRAHLVLVTRGELGVFRRLSRLDLPLPSPSPPFVYSGDGDGNGDEEDRGEIKTEKENETVEVDTGLRLLAGDFFFMDGAPSSWVQQQRRLVATVDLKVARNRYERIDRYAMRPLFGTHRHSLAALVHAQLVVLPLWQLSRSAPLFQRLQTLCHEKYPVLSLSDRNLGARYLAHASRRVDRQLLATSVVQDWRATGAGVGTGAPGAPGGGGPPAQTMFSKPAGAAQEQERVRHTERERKTQLKTLQKALRTLARQPPPLPAPVSGAEGLDKRGGRLGLKGSGESKASDDDNDVDNNDDSTATHAPATVGSAAEEARRRRGSVVGSALFKGVHAERLAEAGDTNVHVSQMGLLSLKQQQQQQQPSSGRGTGAVRSPKSGSHKGLASGGRRASLSFPGGTPALPPACGHRQEQQGLSPTQADRKHGMSVEAFSRQSQDVRDTVATMMGRGLGGSDHRGALVHAQVQAPERPRPSNSSASISSLRGGRTTRLRRSMQPSSY